MSLSRRRLLEATPGACAAAALFGVAPASGAGAPADGAAGAADGPGSVWPEFPRQRPDVVRDMVGACHRDIAKVERLLDEHPALVNATWDWGFGDWETALGAAAHTGRRNIAELLVSRGARPDIFAAAMLGQLDAVKALLSATPGLLGARGPHGIPLLAHAEAGGEPALATLAYLKSLPEASRPAPVHPLTDDQKRGFTGRYQPAAGGPTAVVAVNRNGDVTLAIGGQTASVLRCSAADVFHPSGAPAVRVAFARGPGGGVDAISIVDHGLVYQAARQD